MELLTRTSLDLTKLTLYDVLRIQTAETTNLLTMQDVIF